MTEQAEETSEDAPAFNYKVGDKAWWFLEGVDGFSFVQVTIKALYIEDSSRLIMVGGMECSTPVHGQSCAELWEKYPDAFVFADIDEPVGHDDYVDELCPTLEEMKVYARDIAEDFIQDGITDLKPVDLDEWRKQQVDFIRSTGNLECTLNLYTKKVRGVDWYGPEIAQ